jgi:hypothetical protein
MSMEAVGQAKRFRYDFLPSTSEDYFVVPSYISPLEDPSPIINRAVILRRPPSRDPSSTVAHQ